MASRPSHTTELIVESETTAIAGTEERRSLGKTIMGGFLSSGAIAVHVGTHTYEVGFRGDQKAHHVHDVILSRIGARPYSGRRRRTVTSAGACERIP